MNCNEFRAIRTRLGLNEADFARELGYTGKGQNRVNLIRDFESGKKRVPLYIARLAWLMDQVITARTPQLEDGYIFWPEWPGYTREELNG